MCNKQWTKGMCAGKEATCKINQTVGTNEQWFHWIKVHYAQIQMTCENYGHSSIIITGQQAFVKQIWRRYV